MKKNKALSIMLSMGLINLSFAADLVDPTTPPQIVPTATTAKSVEKPTGTMELTAIFIYPGYRLAAISGRIVKLGDKLGEFTITRITHYTVELVDPQNNRQVLKLVTSVKKERKMDGS